MKKFDKVTRIIYTIIYSVVILAIFLFWKFFVKSIFSSTDSISMFMILFPIAMLFGIYSNACQIVKLYNEEVGKKMLRIFSNIFYIVFMIMYFSSLIYFDYTVIKNHNADIGLLLFSFIFYIPGIIMVKKLIETIKEGIYL